MWPSKLAATSHASCCSSVHERAPSAASVQLQLHSDSQPAASALARTRGPHVERRHSRAIIS
eukprot:1367699-Prymnesium_polylepis.1